MLEKLALLKMALCKASAFKNASRGHTPGVVFPATGSPLRKEFCSIVVPLLKQDWPFLVLRCPVGGARARQ
jgi:hypothetical protein